jgi:hypothetical protein
MRADESTDVGLFVLSRIVVVHELKFNHVSDKRVPGYRFGCGRMMGRKQTK